jgi:hypothetical protein
MARAGGAVRVVEAAGRASQVQEVADKRQRPRVGWPALGAPPAAVLDNQVVEDRDGERHP